MVDTTRFLWILIIFDVWNHSFLVSSYFIHPRFIEKNTVIENIHSFEKTYTACCAKIRSDGDIHKRKHFNHEPPHQKCIVHHHELQWIKCFSGDHHRKSLVRLWEKWQHRMNTAGRAVATFDRFPQMTKQTLCRNPGGYRCQIAVTVSQLKKDIEKYFIRWVFENWKNEWKINVKRTRLIRTNLSNVCCWSAWQK